MDGVDAIGLSDTAASAWTDTPRPRAPTQIKPFDVCSYPNFFRISVYVGCAASQFPTSVDERPSRLCACAISCVMSAIFVRPHAANNEAASPPSPTLNEPDPETLNLENISSVVVRYATGS